MAIGFLADRVEPTVRFRLRRDEDSLFVTSMLPILPDGRRGESGVCSGGLLPRGKSS